MDRPYLQTPVGEHPMRSVTTPSSRRFVALSSSVLLLAAALTIITAPAGAQASLDGCPHSQGFWKNHAELWPVETLTLGDHAYEKAELLALLEMPTKGDASMILAHQLTAAKLNVAGGADADLFETAIEEADGLLAPYEGALPYDVKNQRGPPSADRAPMVETAETLDALNDEDDPAACGTPPGEIQANVGISAHGFTTATGQPVFDINVTSTGPDAATNVTFTLNVSAIDGTDAEGGWDLKVNTTHPDDHRSNIACRDVALTDGRLTATCEIELDMDAGDWVDLRLVGSGWDGQALDLTVGVTADVDTDATDDQDSASLGA